MVSMTKTIGQNQHNHFDIDAILSELGGFGKFQIINFTLICISVILSAATSLTYVFATGNLNYRCNVTECDTRPAEYAPNWLIHAVPYDHEIPEKCFRYKSSVVNATQCYDVTSFETSTKIRCEDFVFESDEVTLLNEFNLTCEENEWKLAFVGTINGLALLVAIPALGYLSDRYGRRTLFILGLFFSTVFGMIKSFSSIYSIYIVCEFLEAAIGAGAYATSFILAMELLEPKKRVIGGTLIACSYTIGEIYLGVIAMHFTNFRTQLQILYAPLLAIISYFWLIPESVRWLAITGKTKQASKTILRAAKVNSIKLSENVLNMIQAVNFDTLTEAKKEKNNASGAATKNGNSEQQESFLDVLRSKTLLARLMNCSFCWITNALVYYGLSLNSVNLAGSKYVNFMLVCAAEIPGYFITIMVMEHVGRKWTLCGSLVTCGLSCLASQYLPNDEPVLRLILFLVGKSAITVSFTVLYVYTAELYPTNLRNSLVCACSMVGRIGSIVAPQTPLLIRFYEPLPLLLFGCSSIISGLLVLRLPETLNTNLPDTIDEAKRLGENSQDTKVTGIMAMPFIIQHDENIYSLDEKAQVKLKKPPLYYSKFREDVLNGVKRSQTDHHKTMGYAEVPLNAPDEFTKRNSRIFPPRPHTDRHRCKPKPPIPTAITFRKSTANVNFRVKNIRSAVTTNPNRPLPRYVDTRNGDFHDLKKSGLVPKYIHQPQYGKIPKYLAKRIYNANMDEEMYRKEQIREQPLCRFVTQPERTALLEGLKANWQELQTIYQGLSLVTDTIPKKQRKTALENNLRQLEKDILLLENHRYIYETMNNLQPVSFRTAPPELLLTSVDVTTAGVASNVLNSSTENLIDSTAESNPSNHLFSSFRSNMERRLTERTQNWRTNFNNVFNEIRPIIQHSQSVNVNNNIFNNFRTSDRQVSEPVPQISQAQSSDSYVINFDGPSSSQPAMYYSNAPIADRSIHEQHSVNDPNIFTHENHAPRPDRQQIQNSPNTQGNAPQHRHNNNSVEEVTDAFAQIPEARDMMTALMRYFPYVCIILAKTCYDLSDGILHFCSLYITFSHANYVVREEIGKHAQRSTFKLLRELLYISVVIFIISYLMDNSIFIVSLVTASTPLAPLTLRQLLFSVGVTDLILKLLTVAIKICIALMPASWIEYKGRGRIFLMTESISQFCRGLAPIQPWLIFLLDSYSGWEKIFGVVLAAAYMVGKGSDLVQTAKFVKRAFIELLKKVSFGSTPTKEQLQCSGSQCPICHDSYTSPVLLECRHIFCELCVSRWFEREQTCPLCRAKVADDPSWRDGATTMFNQFY
ncbi:Organic cation transporter protein [Pseudolycoriella hygida]|uniref:Organic cation transporter protein n=1 Tax=Pseudolycoriella hygida TaxID=35572 RepID=A0A9Q0MVU2_9DIPT|nr:Organic cation transporter protein [Pseudolycoriella hygida]